MSKKRNYQKLKEIELSASGVDPFVRVFDYTDAQWAEIELSVQPAHKGPLTEDVRQCLRQAGAVYVALRRTGNDFLKQQELTTAANWENIHGLSAALFGHLVSLDRWKYRGLLKSLAKLRDASIASANNSSLPLREDYYRGIFGVWVDTLGGRLGVSRDSGNHKLGGPLIRFFQAVTRPVLGAEAPALESISGIIYREKERRESRRKVAAIGAGEHVRESRRKAPALWRNEVGHYSDLGHLGVDPESQFDTQMHDYVVQRGRETGHKYIVAVNADGVVLAHGFGDDITILPKNLTNALYDPKSRIVIHRNQRSPAGLNSSDISLLALPGLQAIFVHGHRGYTAHGALTLKGRTMLRGNTTQEACVRLMMIAHGVESRLFEVLNKAVMAGRLRPYQADIVSSHLVGLALRDSGIIDYCWESSPGRRSPPIRA